MEEAKFKINLKSDGSVIISAQANALDEFEALILVTKELYNKHFSGAGAAAPAAEKSPAQKAKEFLEASERENARLLAENGGTRNRGQRSDRPGAEKPTPAGFEAKCKFCGGPMWDNTGPGGKNNPKSPDYKCKSKTCEAAAWIQKDHTLKWSK